MNTIAAGVMSTPPRTPPRIPGDSNTKQRSTCSTGNIPVRGLLGFLGIPLGSHHILERCGKFRRAAKDELDTTLIFLGPRRHWKRLPTMFGKDFAMPGYLTVLMFLI